MVNFSLKALVVAATLATTGAGQAATINYTVDGGWDRFNVGAVGTQVSRQFSFSLTKNAILTIVDGFLPGDQFEVFANGSSLGTTSAPGTGPTTGMRFDAALADGIHSMGQFILGPGSYLISLTVLSRSGTDTRGHIGALRVDTAAVPVPAAGALLLTALGAMAFRRRRRTA